jgi:hypothetical protein
MGKRIALLASHPDSFAELNVRLFSFKMVDSCLMMATYDVPLVKVIEFHDDGYFTPVSELFSLRKKISLGVKKLWMSSFEIRRDVAERIRKLKRLLSSQRKLD